ncbi:MAG TPA: cytochrome c [Telluria sp.]|nr:cytochrome c [Telluria sp.]
MDKWIKRGAMVVGSVALVAAAAAVAGKVLGERKMARTLDIPVKPVAVFTDAAHIEHGRYLFSTRGCAECHGENGAGKVVIADGEMLVVAPNLTGGAHSVTAAYKDEDWVRTLRHGVKPNGRPVLVMPSEDYNRLTDEDVGSLISYVRSLPAVDGQATQIRFPLPATALYGFGAIRDAAEKIDHTLPPSEPVPVGVSVQHGAYVANACIGCHGATLSGGTIPGAPPNWPAAANLTPGKGSAMIRYADPESFMAMMRTRKRPDGTPISPVMPFDSLARMTDTDMRALHAYLKTVPAREFGNR